MMAHFHSFATIMFQKKNKKRNRFCKIYCREVIKGNLWKVYIENSNIQRNIKKILHLVQELYFEINVKFKQKSLFH